MSEIFLQGNNTATFSMALSKVPASFTRTRTVCLTSCFQNRNWSDDLQYRPHVLERAKSVTSFYNQSAIDSAASKVSFRNSRVSRSVIWEYFPKFLNIRNSGNVVFENLILFSPLRSRLQDLVSVCHALVNHILIVYRMGRLCGGAHEISGIKVPLFLHGWVVVGWCAGEGCITTCGWWTKGG